MGWGGSALSVRELTQSANDYFSICFYVAMFFYLSKNVCTRTGIAGSFDRTAFYNTVCKRRNKGVIMFLFFNEDRVWITFRYRHRIN